MHFPAAGKEENIISLTKFTSLIHIKYVAMNLVFGKYANIDTIPNY